MELSPIVGVAEYAGAPRGQLWTKRSSCVDIGFKKVTLRGHRLYANEAPDRWDEQEVEFVFGMDASECEEDCGKPPRRAWKRLKRRPKYQVKTLLRQRPKNVKQAIVREREYKNIHTVSKMWQSLSTRPCMQKAARSFSVLVEKGEQRLFDGIVYFFTPVEEIVESNERCNPENLIAQLKSGVRCARDTARVMALGAGLLLPEKGRWASRNEPLSAWSSNRS